MALFNLDFSWASAISLPAARTGYARSSFVPLGTLGTSNELSEGNAPNMRSERTTHSGPSVSLYALTAKLSRSSFFS